MRRRWVIITCRPHPLRYLAQRPSLFEANAVDDIRQQGICQFTNVTLCASGFDLLFAQDLFENRNISPVLYEKVTYNEVVCYLF